MRDAFSGPQVAKIAPASPVSEPRSLAKELETDRGRRDLEVLQARERYSVIGAV